MSEKIKVGDEFRHQFKFSQDDVQKFGEVTGDFNPLHFDTEYTAQTPFKKPIIHGHLGSSVFTRYLGMERPGGAGSIYVKQITEYLRPMYVEVAYEVAFRIQSIDSIKHIAEISTEIKDITTQKITIRGIGVLMNKELY